MAGATIRVEFRCVKTGTEVTAIEKIHILKLNLKNEM
jgi:hypothetical protein